MPVYEAEIEVLEALEYGTSVLDTAREQVEADDDEDAKRAAKRLALTRMDACGGGAYTLKLTAGERVVLVHDPVEHRHGTGH